ncbi:hypothetical protein Pelo_14440 [Pelomyxa schiedti]|nr:hypothetical protein Pelo_14440 [Pelomyxa schiedti]
MASSTSRSNRESRLVTSGQDVVGKLLLFVIKGTNLASRDLSGTSDPFVTLALDGDPTQQYKTRTIPTNLNPVWDASCEVKYDFNFFTPLSLIDLTVWDDNKVMAAVFMGHTTIDVVKDGLADQEPHELCLKLAKKTAKDGDVTGEVHLRAQFKYRVAAEPVYKTFAALKSRSWSVVLRLATTSLQIFPTEYRLYLARAEAHMKKREFSEALSSIDNAEHFANSFTGDVNRASSEVYYWKGMILFEKGDYDVARDAFEMGLQYSPDEQRLHAAMAQLALRITKKKIRTALDAGKLSFTAKKYENAVGAFSEAIKLNPQNGTYYIYRALVHIKMMNLDDAVSDVNSAVELQPQWLQVDNLKVGNLQKQGHVNLMMKRRFFVCKDHFLMYLASEKEGVVRGVIILASECAACKRKSRSQFSLVTPSRTYEFKADSETDANEWVVALEKTIASPVVIPNDPHENHYIRPDTRRVQAKLLIAADKLLSRQQQLSYLPLTAGYDHAGYLYKMGQVNTSWQKRYFVLLGTTLYYTDLSNLVQSQQDNPSRLAGIQPLGSIDLSTSCVWSQANSSISRDFAFELKTSYRTYYLAAENQAKYDGWKAALINLSKANRNLLDYELLEDETSPTDNKEEAADPSLEVDSVKYAPGHIRSVVVTHSAAVTSTTTPSHIESPEARFFSNIGLNTGTSLSNDTQSLSSPLSSATTTTTTTTTTSSSASGSDSESSTADSASSTNKGGVVVSQQPTTLSLLDNLLDKAGEDTPLIAGTKVKEPTTLYNAPSKKKSTIKSKADEAARRVSGFGKVGSSGILGGASAASSSPAIISSDSASSRKKNVINEPEDGEEEEEEEEDDDDEGGCCKCNVC